MKTFTRNTFGLLVVLLAFGKISAQIQPNFCPGNYFANGGFEIGTPINLSNTISLAQSWDRIWIGNETADFYDQNNSAFGPLSAPTPPSGNYSSLWIDNRVGDATFREGMINRLTIPVSMNTGNYSISFEVACLFRTIGDNAEIGVYAVNAGPYQYPNHPAASHVPTNLTLYSNNIPQISQDIALLGNVQAPSNCNGAKQNVSFTFNTNTLNFSGPITHILITKSGSIKNAREYVAMDGFCMVRIEDPADPGIGAYCCDGRNLVRNGNFEYGNMDFTSNYAQTPTTYPGEYDVTTTAAAFGANVTDHSFCVDPIAYPQNQNFMVVNGRTQQTGSSIIWEQTISGLKEGDSYRFCANFKNMPQCTFDILPKITMEAGSFSSGQQPINTVPSNPCDWQSVDMYFTATGNNETLRIVLNETGDGDGNDLAIDDIGVFDLQDPGVSITVQHQGSPQQITASINSIDPLDDVLPGNCEEYYWFVAEVISFPPIAINWSTFASGNQNTNPAWNLTTTFPGYVFNQNTMYIIGLYLPECGCYEESLTYQLTYNNLANSPVLTSEQEAKIIDLILNGIPDGTTEAQGSTQDKMMLYPNPASGILNLSLREGNLSHIQIYSVQGKVVKDIVAKGGSKSESIDVSGLSSGMYFVKATGSGNQRYQAKFIKK